MYHYSLLLIGNTNPLVLSTSHNGFQQLLLLNQVAQYKLISIWYRRPYDTYLYPFSYHSQIPKVSISNVQTQFLSSFFSNFINLSNILKNHSILKLSTYIVSTTDLNKYHSHVIHGILLNTHKKKYILSQSRNCSLSVLCIPG